ncbi:MAG: carbamoyltransferase HypF [bacterium]
MMKNNEDIKRAVIRLSGRVQGVGFRPFVFRLSEKYCIKGYVLNDLEGVTIDAEGKGNDLANFIKFLDLEKPPLAVITAKTVNFTPPIFYNSFNIKESDKQLNHASNNSNVNFNLTVSPDVGLCGECLKELLNPSDRRYLYPFINCTDCGPRFTIIKGMPYDRALTAMYKFKMCPACEGEYKNPLNRRFHAEPNGCFLCGPEVEFILNKPNCKTPELLSGISSGSISASKGLTAVKSLAELIRNGGIACVKGIGGFHLMADATNDKAVKLLRDRKNRPAKPFAVMFKDISEALKYVYIGDISSSLMLSKERPVCLLKDRGNLAYSVNCGIKYTGAFLPYAPIHYVIFNLLDKPLVATSANIGGEPIVKDNEEAIHKLKYIADGFLIHNRDIIRRCDDSVVKVAEGGEDNRYNQVFIRRSRGYAPDSVQLPFKLKRNIFAAGSYLKNTFAIAYKGGNMDGGGAVILSQHNGDLDSIGSFAGFIENAEDFERLYNFKPGIIVCDSHPAYENTKWAQTKAAKGGIKCVPLQHHRAHIISCMAENGIEPNEEVFGAAFDGTGYGDEGSGTSIWGGEFFKGSYINLKRVGSFKRFRLLGGDKAVKSPRRVLLSILFGLFLKNGDENDNHKNFNENIGNIAKLTSFSAENIKVFLKMWEGGINSPYTSSCGRIFDAVSCLCGFKGGISYEGEAAIYLEDLCTGDDDGEGGDAETDFFEYNINYNKADELFIVDYNPMFKQIIDIIFENSGNLEIGGSGSNISINPTGLNKLPDTLYKNIADRFINTLVLIIRDMALRADCKNVCMGGGVFQNAFLRDRAARILKKSGFNVFLNKKIPANDGGISFGQAVYGGLIDIND